MASIPPDRPEVSLRTLPTAGDTAHQLQDVSERLHGVLEHMPDAFCLLDREWTYRYLNAAAEVLLRRPRGELLGQVAWDVFPEIASDGVRDALERTLESGTPTRLELHSPRLDTWVEVNAHPSEAGLAVYFRDIGKRKEAEERLRVFTTTTSDAIWEWDLETDLLTWNEGIETLFGHRRDEMDPTSRFWRTSIAAADERRVTGGLSRSLSCGDRTWADEFRFQRADGSYAHVYARARILHDETGTARRVIGGLTDVSDRKRLEAQTLRAQRMESIGTLAGGMAHDLNNVLTPILLSLDVLRDLVDEPGARELFDTIQRSAQRGADLVAQVLSFARGLDGERLPIRVASLVDEVRHLVLETFPKSITCHIEVAEDVWAVHGDRTQLHQVLMNLCVNARDAMPRGGRLSVAAANRVIDALYAQQHPGTSTGSYVVLQVEDTGTGMTAPVREKMFEPFFTTKETGSGTGLGLSTSLAIVRSHGGFISVSSEPGRGSLFRVHLPAAPTTLDATPRLAAAAPRGQGELVLVVDDEPSVRVVAQRTLERHGYRVLTAANGAEAVALFASHLAEAPVVFTDMTMPVMDGPSAIAALRALDPSVRIIGSSGLGAEGEQARLVSGAVQRFVPKPYTAEQLLQVLREVIDADG